MLERQMQHFWQPLYYDTVKNLAYANINIKAI